MRREGTVTVLRAGVIDDGIVTLRRLVVAGAAGRRRVTMPSSITPARRTVTVPSLRIPFSSSRWRWSMPQRGEIVVERLTGNRAMVIDVVSPEEITCRFADGRLEDRVTFEVEPLLSLRDPRGGGRFVPLGSLVWLFFSGFVSRWFRQGATASVTDRLRLVRPSESSCSPLAV